jgi:selenide, water dikinase
VVGMTESETLPRLTSLSHGAGCACKLSLDELRAVLEPLRPPAHPDLLVGPDTGDDAAVWRRPAGPALVATTDFFTPLVDDPRTWGRIAAANAVSDVYAMGGTPTFALNLVGWPRDLPSSLLTAVLEGAGEVADEAGYALAGGHTIDSVEPLYGQAVVGEVEEADLLTNAGARVGDALVVTKAIGTGIVTTALKRSPADAALGGDPVLTAAYEAAVSSMVRLNRDAARTAVAAGASAATDVTGFGLLGHLHRLALASGVAAEIDPDAVPLLPHVPKLRDRGAVPGGSQRNADQAARYLDAAVDRDRLLLLADAQTSGGLLIALPPAAAADAVRELGSHGHPAAVIGRIVDGAAGTVRVLV